MAYASAAEQIKNGVCVNPETGCWDWVKFIDRHGYGVVGRNKKVQRAHRVSYEAFRGPIPEGLTIDHLCRNRKCVNPEHLECVTQVENMKRAHKSHCLRGHLLSEDNLYIRNEKRFCKACIRFRTKKWQQDRQEASR